MASGYALGKVASMWDQITEPADAAHVAAVVQLARISEPRCGATVVVAVDGSSGSGKTTLAAAVAAALGAQVVHLDLIYPGWDGLAESVDILATRVLQPLSQARSAAYRRWDWERDEWAEEHVVVPAPYLVVDGCGSSVLPAGAYAAVRVFLDADPALRRARGLTRDGQTYAPHWERWAAQERELFERDGTRRRADLVIDTTTV
jgi:cytidylate kinase